MYHKTFKIKQLEAMRRRCASMRAAKQLKRLASAPSCCEVGVIIFEGLMFNGRHIMTIEARDGCQHVYPRIDGISYKPMTIRGLRSLIAKRIG
jgi:hypothetical protein